MSGAVGQASEKQAGHRAVLDPSIGPAPLPAALEAALPAEEQGLPRAWLAVALSHKSWLYERGSPDGPNGALLGALGQLGNDVLSVELLACLQQTEPQASLARRHGVLAQRVRVLDALAASWELTHYARLGAGEAAQAAAAIGDGRAPAASGAVATQCLGWWSLFGNERRLREQIGARLQAVGQDDAHAQVDAKTLLQEVFAKLGPAYEYEAVGPDHARVFTAVATLRDGRRGRGQGASKKSAGKAAALDLLLTYAPERLQAPSVSEERARAEQAVRRAGRQDADSYRALAGAFGCRRPENFALALTHRSWTYERFRDVDLDAGSNTLLAHAGRHAFDLVLNRLRVLRMLRSTVTPTPDQARLHSVPDDEFPPLLDVLDVSHLVRLGAGQRRQGFPTEMKANCVQAVFGAAMLEHRYVWQLELAVPAHVNALLNDLADSDPFDPSTRLQRELASLGVDVREVSSVASGPDHAKHFEATVALASAPRRSSSKEKARASARRGRGPRGERWRQSTS